MPAGHIQTRPSFGLQGKGFSSAADKTLLIMVPVFESPEVGFSVGKAIWMDTT